MRHLLIKKILLAVCAASLCVGTGALTACGGTEDLAAKCGSFSITEQAVTDYTAQFRTQNSLADDDSWVSYLKAQGLDTKGWREEAIRTLSQRELVKQKADELGITADETTVEQSIQNAKSGYDSDEAWEEALSAKGMDDQSYRETLEFSSIEQQVLVSELNVDSDADSSSNAEAVSTYVDQNLADRVTRRYEVVSFASKDEAKAALAELSALQGDELSKRFSEYVSTQSEALSDIFSGDLGWDISYDVSSFISGSDNLKLQAGSLYKKTVKSDGVWKIYLCTGRYVFEKGLKAKDIEDESLKSLVEQAAVSSQLATQAEGYLNQLVDDANVQVYQMPSGLPYDVATE